MKHVDNRSVWIDDIRVVATLAVIVIHVATQSVFTQYNLNNSAWWVGNVYDSFCRFCVPVFVMISGALLLPQGMSLGQFLQKRLNRILLPFLFWSVIYIMFDLLLKVKDQHGASPDPGGWLFRHLAEGAAPHLWYVYMLAGLYLFIPIIQPWVANASDKAILFFLLIWFLTVIFSQQDVVKVNSPLDVRYFSGYVGYLILGYFIAHRAVVRLSVMWGAALLFLTGAVVTTWGTYISTARKGAISHEYYEYLTVNVVLASVGIFILFKAIGTRGVSTEPGPVSKFIGRYGYGIYLSHLLVLSILAHFGINYSLITPAIGIPLTSVICLLISAAIVFIINKLPYGRYISG